MVRATRGIESGVRGRTVLYRILIASSSGDFGSRVFVTFNSSNYKPCLAILTGSKHLQVIRVTR